MYYNFLKNMNKKAFSFVEIIIVISIFTILAVITTTVNNNMKTKSFNSKIVSDLSTIENALISFTNEWNKLPLPKWNNNFFDVNWVYIHGYEDEETFWAYWKFTQDSLVKKYLDSTPIDPRTNQYYSYGISKNSNQFEIAWVLYSDNWNTAKVKWNYTAEEWIYNLIREYNWADFVIDWWTNLPYNPYERILVATTIDWTIYKEWDTIISTGTKLEIFFSDWSTSIIEPNTTLVLSEMDFPKDTNLVSNIKLFLQAGSIWTNATKLDEDSSFEIYTTDVTASVRWTIFAIEKENTQTLVSLKVWVLELEKINNTEEALKNNLRNRKNINKEKFGNNYNIDWKFKESKFFKPENDWTTYTLRIKDWDIGQAWEIENIDFSEPENKSAPKIEKIEEKEFLNEIEDKSCYLDWREVENWKTIPAYNKECEEQEKTCENWILSWNIWDIEYMYRTCPTIIQTQCDFYKDDFFEWSLNKRESKTLTKTRPIEISYWNLEVTEKLTKTIKCKDNFQYYISDIAEIKTCNAIPHFKENCEDTTPIAWYDLVYYQSGSINDLKIGDIDFDWDGIWDLDLWNNFAFVFDIEEISQSYSDISYIKYNNNIILKSKNNLLKLNDVNPSQELIVNDLIKTSNEIITDYKNNFQIKFEWKEWKSVSITEFSDTYKWIPTFLNWNNITLSNISNLKIYKWSPIEMSWNWCDKCPFWEHENINNTNRDGENCHLRWGGEKDENYCIDVKWYDWLDVICKREDNWCDDFENWNWSWYLKK